MDKAHVSYAGLAVRFMVERGIFREEPFSMLDIGCSGGLFPLGRIFERDLSAHGFDPVAEECLRLEKSEQNPNVHYHARVVGLPDGHEWLRRKAEAELYQCPYPDEQYRRSSASQHAASIRAKSQGAQPSVSTANQTPEKKISLTEFVEMQRIRNVDFIKIDTDGADLEVLISAEACIERLAVLGFLVECQYQGSDHDTCNTFHNIDRFMKRRGYHIFSMNVAAFSRAALPAAYLGQIPSPTIFGQPAFGDVAFLKDPIWGVTGEPSDLPTVKLLKLICLYEYFKVPDCAAELIQRYRDAIRSLIDPDELLDLLTPPLGRKKISYAEYLGHVAANPRGLVDEAADFINDALRQVEARELKGVVGRIRTRNDETRLSRGNPIRIQTPAAKWAYAAEFPLEIPPATSGEVWIRIRAQVLGGEASFGVLHRDETRFQQRKSLFESSEQQTIFLQVTDPEQAKSVILENASGDSRPTEVLLSEVTALVVNRLTLRT